MVQPYSGILFSSMKGKMTDTCNMDGSQKHIKWKKPDTKDYFPEFPVYEILGKNKIVIESRSVFGRGWG